MCNIYYIILQIIQIYSIKWLTIGSQYLRVQSELLNYTRWYQILDRKFAEKYLIICPLKTNWSETDDYNGFTLLFRTSILLKTIRHISNHWKDAVMHGDDLNTLLWRWKITESCNYSPKCLQASFFSYFNFIFHCYLFHYLKIDRNQKLI